MIAATLKMHSTQNGSRLRLKGWGRRRSKGPKKKKNPVQVSGVLYKLLQQAVLSKDCCVFVGTGFF